MNASGVRKGDTLINKGRKCEWVHMNESRVKIKQTYMSE